MISHLNRLSRRVNTLDIHETMHYIVIIDNGNTPTRKDDAMLTLYKFHAYNTQAMYGWGDDAEAEAYCEFLNRDREINVYSYSEITDEAEIAKHDGNGEGVNLADAIQEIADNDA